MIVIRAILKEAKDWKLYIGIIIGCIISGLGIGGFLVPNNIASGGVTGAAIVINSFLPIIPVGKMTIILNIPIFLVCIFTLGSSFGIKSLVATFILGFAIDIWGSLPIPTNDYLLASLFGGTVTGLGLGIVIKSNATTGGTDLIAKIVHKIFSVISLGQILLIIDIAVVISATIVFKSVEIGLYAGISIYITSTTIDGVIVGINFSKAAYIISDKSDEIAKGIQVILDRGVTGIHGKGMFTGDDKQILLCVLRRREIPKLKRLVKDIDSKAFVFLSEAREVFGEGFTPNE